MHAIGGLDIVLDQNRDAMQRAPDLATLALGIERVGNGQRIGVEFDDRIDRRPRSCELSSPRCMRAARSDTVASSTAGISVGGFAAPAITLDAEIRQVRMEMPMGKAVRCIRVSAVR